MDNILPYDVIHIISLYCEPYELAINKNLYNLYNDLWFQNKLEMLYSDLALYTSTNYIDLYKKYSNLKS